MSAAVSASKTIIPEGNLHFVSLTSYFNDDVRPTAYDVPTLSSNLDWIGVMDYDFHGPWDGYTGHIAPLYHKAGDPIDFFNVDSSIQTWLSLEASPSKLIVGVPTYGKSYTLSNPGSNGLNAPTSGEEKYASESIPFPE